MQIKKYPQKNLNNNKTLYFQIALILVLIISLISIEWKSYGKPIQSDKVETQIDFIDRAYVLKIPENKPELIEKDEKPKKQEVEPVIDDHKDDKIFENSKTELNFDPNKILEGLEKPISSPIPDVISGVVEEFPVFPGCERYQEKEERRNCMNKKIFKLVGKHFDTGLGNQLNLSGLQKIDVSFRVSHTGEVEFIDARAPHPKLKEEAERIIQKIPEMVPGKMGGQPVNVLFMIPVKFEVNRQN